MHLLDIVNRAPRPQPWEEVAKIPWDDPQFSARMLREHLSQAHDAASRRTETITAQVDWLHHALLEGRPADILDLGCGPGLYCAELARLGHSCTGIDFGPASIAHARQTAADAELACSYIQGDLRSTPFGPARDLIMLLFGEFNTFQPAEALDILSRSHAALAPGGQLAIEVHPLAAIQAMGAGPPTWSAQEQGLFADAPYIRVDDACWHPDSRTAVARHYVIDAATAEVTRYGTTTQGYTRDAYESLLCEAGFDTVAWRADWPNTSHAGELELLVAVR